MTLRCCAPVDALQLPSVLAVTLAPAIASRPTPKRRGLRVGLWLGGLAACAIAPVLLAPVALGAAGFTAVGPAAGSLAASWMSAIATANGGGVAAGTLYATLQSMAMGGAALPVGGLAAGGAGAYVAASGAVKGIWHAVSAVTRRGRPQAEKDKPAGVAQDAATEHGKQV